MHANFTALSSIESELLPPTEVLHCRNREFRAFLQLILDLDPMTFIYELDPYPSEIFHRPKLNFLRQGFGKLSYYIHTDRHIQTYVAENVTTRVVTSTSKMEFDYNN